MTKMTGTQNEAIIETIYNVLLTPETTEEERAILLTAKKDLENGHKDQEKVLLALQGDIQRLAMSHVSDKVSLSQGMRQLSQQLTALQNKAERDINIARGLLSTGMFFGR